MLQLVTLVMTPATALYAIGGLLASPLVIPALIIKNLLVLVSRVGHKLDKVATTLGLVCAYACSSFDGQCMQLHDALPACLHLVLKAAHCVIPLRCSCHSDECWSAVELAPTLLHGPHDQWCGI